MLGTIGAAVAILASAPSAAQPAAEQGRETAIPFVRSNGIVDWQADGDRGLFIRASDGHWYYGRTMNKCGRLRSAMTVGFETRGVDQLDRHGAVLVQGWRCPLESVTRAASPERKKD